MIKVLMVDDDPEMRECVGGFLKSRGFETRSSKTGEEAIEMLEKDPPDCVLLDLHLPEGISGIEVLKKIKKWNTNIKVLVITGFIDREKENECISAGANGYIMKPINFPELENTIKNVVDKQ